jgi:hypothetical protein
MKNKQNTSSARLRIQGETEGEERKKTKEDKQTKDNIGKTVIDLADLVDKADTIPNQKTITFTGHCQVT